ADDEHQLLNTRDMTPVQIQHVWNVIALHTTADFTEYKESEVALLFHGVGMDIMSDNVNQFSEEIRRAVTQKLPRNNFKNDIIEAFCNGFRHKPRSEERRVGKE